MNHWATGTEKPIFGRRRIDSGSSCPATSRRRIFVCRPWTLRRIGSCAANSTRRWSSSGERASSEFAIVARSILTSRSSGR